MCLRVSDKSFPPPHPPSPHLPPHPPSPPPHPKNNHTVIRRQCCETFSSILQRAKHLATCQLSCNVTTSSKCAICDKLQEKIRSIASRPAQKGTGKSSEQSIKSVSQAACASGVGQKFPPTSPPPSLPPPPTPKIITRSIVDNVVKRFKHLSMCQASCNVPTSLQPHNIF